jgi:hypothetical protein
LIRLIIPTIKIERPTKPWNANRSILASSGTHITIKPMNTAAYLNILYSFSNLIYPYPFIFIKRQQRNEKKEAEAPSFFYNVFNGYHSVEKKNV